jgi:alpha-galactosidase
MRRSVFQVCFAIMLLTIAVTQSPASDNGLAKAPPMGWNSWNKYACDGLNEKVVREAADTLAANGMKDAGYEYVVIDDCWQTGRDAQGNILADPATFPSGIKALADYIHRKGLKFGIYTDAGIMTCAKRPGSMGHEFQDAKQYANWGVDYLKEDWCNTLPGQNSESSYTLMREALKASGRPIVFSICEWGSTKPWLWAGQVGNLWRATPDIQDCWDCKRTWGGGGVMQIMDLMDGIESYSGPGHWNDPDMLEVGNGKLTLDENRFHMTLWAMLAAPLLAGNNLTAMTPEVGAILMNKQVIAVDQDPAGHQGERIFEEGPIQIWSRQLADGSLAMAIFNTGEDANEMRGIPMPLKQMGFKSAPHAVDLWTNKSIGVLDASYRPTLARHAAVFLKLTK